MTLKPSEASGALVEVERLPKFLSSRLSLVLVVACGDCAWPKLEKWLRASELCGYKLFFLPDADKMHVTSVRAAFLDGVDFLSPSGPADSRNARRIPIGSGRFQQTPKAGENSNAVRQLGCSSEELGEGSSGIDRSQVQFELQLVLKRCACGILLLYVQVHSVLLPTGPSSEVLPWTCSFGQSRTRLC